MLHTALQVWVILYGGPHGLVAGSIGRPLEAMIYSVPVPSRQMLLTRLYLYQPTSHPALGVPIYMTAQYKQGMKHIWLSEPVVADCAT